MRESLYQQVYENVRDDIRAHRYEVGARLPTESELLEKYEVSAITLKRALDMLREQGYIDRRPRRGTFVISDVGTTESVRDSRLPTIGCVVTNFDDSFGSHIIGALLDPDSGANVVLKRSLGDQAVEESLVRGLVASDVDGVILQPGSSAFVPPAVLELVMQRFPVAILDRVFDGVPVSSVVSDNVDAGRIAAKYLIDLGHTHLALVTSHSAVTTVGDRQSGFLHAHAAAHIPHEPYNEFHGLESTLPGSQVPPGDDVEKLRVFIRERPDVTGFVVTEYNLAVLLRAALELENRNVPDDASIVSFDQPDAFFPAGVFQFTHIAQDQAAMGREAIRLVRDQIVNPGAVEQLMVPVRLIIGESTLPHA